MHQNLQQISENGSKCILVVGDCMVDRYTWGNTERVSPEAPVLVLQADHQDLRPGGAASVAFLLAGLGLPLSITLAGVVGEDGAARSLRRVLEECGIDTSLLIVDPDRPTTTKERFIGRASTRHAHQILRVDLEASTSIGSSTEQRLLEEIASRVNAFDAILIADYEKGVCTPSLLDPLIRSAARHGVPVLVDPGRSADLQLYRGASLIKPNRAEAAGALGRSIVTIEDAIEASKKARASVEAETVVVTLDRDGVLVLNGSSLPLHVPTRSRNVYDVTGAGDMALAVLGVARCHDASLEDAARLINVASGLQVEELGVTPIPWGRILDECRSGGTDTLSKVTTLDRLVELVSAHRRQGRTVVLANGCFDLLHAGHVRHLTKAAQMGDVLIVAVNSDESVRRLKGPERPIVSQSFRAEVLAGLGCVDHVVVFEATTPKRLLESLRPDVLAKGGDYNVDTISEAALVRSYGGTVCTTCLVEGLSTTQLVSRISPRNNTASAMNA